MPPVDLKGCPFCGGAMQPRHALWPSEGDTDGIIHASPTDCPLPEFSVHVADRCVSATEAWNNRAPLLSLRDRRETVVVLKSLANAADSLSFREAEIREIVGNTNWNVLRHWIDEARAILALPLSASPAAAGLSEQEQHAIGHAKYLVEQASPDAPEVCFDYELVETLLRLLERALPLSAQPPSATAVDADMLAVLRRIRSSYPGYIPDFIEAVDTVIAKADALPLSAQPERAGEWQPIESEPDDGAFRWYGLHVKHKSGHEWFEAYYLQRDDDDGQMTEPSGDVFSAWSFDDFEVWSPAPQPPAAPLVADQRQEPKP